MGEPVKIMDLAEELIRLSGFEEALFLGDAQPHPGVPGWAGQHAVTLPNARRVSASRTQPPRAVEGGAR